MLTPALSLSLMHCREAVVIYDGPAERGEGFHGRHIGEGVDVQREYLNASLNHPVELPMSNIDKQRIAAVRKLEELGYSFADGDWIARAMPAGDTLHALLVSRAGALASPAQGSEQRIELLAITNAIAAYEAVRWPHGRTPDESMEGGWNCGQLILSP